MFFRSNFVSSTPIWLIAIARAELASPVSCRTGGSSQLSPAFVRTVSIVRQIVTTAVLLAMSLPALSAEKATMLNPTVSQVAAGGNHTCALTAAGPVECWGDNSFGQLGNNNASSGIVKIPVSGLADAIALVAGDGHTCALTLQGFVRCWGNNGLGQLGNGTNTNQPAPVATLVGGIAALAAGYSHTCGLTASGLVLCWGYNGFGQLGDGTKTSKNAPGVAVIGLTDVVAISAGIAHSCALTRAGAVKCWGSNAYGRLGDGTTTGSTTPVAVSGLDRGVADIVAAGRHTCALTRVGTVKCWGYNGDGELGDGTTTDRSTPVAVSGLTGIVGIAGNNYHTCALAAAGTVTCWGQNGSGELGNGGSANASVPVPVSGLADVAAITAGGNHTCARSTLGGVKCWGYNSYGQVGDGGTTNQALAVDVQGHIASAVAAIGMGAQHTCAVTTAGGPLCWGHGSSHQLGTGTAANAVLAPSPVSGLLGVAQIAGGAAHTCARTVSGAALCWGLGLSGQIGDGAAVQRFTPAGVSGLGSGVAFIAASHDGTYSCAVTTAGAAKCWGTNLYGQLGDGSKTQRNVPVNVTGLASGVAAIAAGLFHTCSLSIAGAVQCWGLNDYGQLGDGTRTDHLTPAPVTGLGSGVVALTAGDKHTCALTTTGAVRCWGWNRDGQIAADNLAWTTTPVTPTGLTGGIAHIAAGASHTCVVTTVGAAKCMGSNALGQLGDTSGADQDVPVDVLGLDSAIVGLDAGGDHTCALSVAGTLHCWGDNEYDQLGFDHSAIDHLNAAFSLLRGRSLAFEPAARVGVGTKAYASDLFASAENGSPKLELWTPDTCSVVFGQVTFSNPGLCGVRITQGTDSSLTTATPPHQIRLIQVESDLLFANGLDVWGGMKH
jgi:alpha-tubulin suppressor-like RCC1 family protein